PHGRRDHPGERGRPRCHLHPLAAFHGDGLGLPGRGGSQLTACRALSAQSIVPESIGAGVPISFPETDRLVVADPHLLEEVPDFERTPPFRAAHRLVAPYRCSGAVGAARESKPPQHEAALLAHSPGRAVNHPIRLLVEEGYSLVYAVERRDEAMERRHLGVPLIPPRPPVTRLRSNRQ